MNSHEVFIHIHQGCFAGTGAIVRLPQCQWRKPDGYGKISQCITTTKHSKAKTMCIFLGIYCKSIFNSVQSFSVLTETQYFTENANPSNSLKSTWISSGLCKLTKVHSCDYCYQQMLILQHSDIMQKEQAISLVENFNLVININEQIAHVQQKHFGVHIPPPPPPHTHTPQPLPPPHPPHTHTHPTPSPTPPPPPPPYLILCTSIFIECRYDLYGS